MSGERARVTARGAERWTRGHPWIYRSDVAAAPEAAGLVSVYDPRDKFVGQALFSPRSEIQLRLLERTERTIDVTWWREKLVSCLARRAAIDASAYRVVHAEGDGLPSLIVDRYDRWVVAQLLSAGLETRRDDLFAAIVEVLQPEGILLRHDNATRQREGLSSGVVRLDIHGPFDEHPGGVVVEQPLQRDVRRRAGQGRYRGWTSPGTRSGSRLVASK